VDVIVHRHEPKRKPSTNVWCTHLINHLIKIRQQVLETKMAD